MAIIHPKGTASWLVQNTALSFAQIADFCELHVTEIQAIADGEVKISASSPLGNFQLSLEEIKKGEESASYKLKTLKNPLQDLGIKEKKLTKYKTLAHRRVIPDVALYLVSAHPKLSDAQIAKLIGSTKTTVEKIRHGIYKGMSGLTPKDPILTGLCSKKTLDTLLASVADE